VLAGVYVPPWHETPGHWVDDVQPAATSGAPMSAGSASCLEPSFGVPVSEAPVSTALASFAPESGVPVSFAPVSVDPVSFASLSFLAASRPVEPSASTPESVAGLPVLLVPQAATTKTEATNVK
jgi:hypothetical protein